MLTDLSERCHDEVLSSQTSVSAAMMRSCLVTDLSQRCHDDVLSSHHVDPHRGRRLSPDLPVTPLTLQASASELTLLDSLTPPTRLDALTSPTQTPATALTRQQMMQAMLYMIQVRA